MLGIGVASFTEVVGAGPSKDYDILGIKMFDSAELRLHPTGKAILKLGVKSQGQGHETTFAQIVAEELGIPPEDIRVEEGDTDTTPYGLGTYASRSTPTAGAATALIARTLREKAKKIAAHLLEASEDDLDWDGERFSVKGAPDRAKTIQEVIFAAYTNLPEGMDAGLEGVKYYDPPNMTFPFELLRRRRRDRPRHRPVEAAAGRRRRRLRRPDQPDDRRGADHGRPHRGLRDGRDGADHVRRGRQLHRLELHGLPDPDRVGDAGLRARRDRHAVAAPSDRREGVGESATVGSPAAFVNAIVDALAHVGVRNFEMPVTSDKVWQALNEVGLAE